MAQQGTMLTTIIGIVDREGGGFYTHIHDPVKGMLPHAPLPPNPQRQPKFSAYYDTTRAPPNSTCGSCMLTRKLPKMNFPKFEADNPKLWKSRCENYFEMYEVDTSVWVKVASKHFEGPTARWLQSVEHLTRTSTWSELYSWIHERFARD
jgi:hypothetical protein